MFAYWTPRLEDYVFINVFGETFATRFILEIIYDRFICPSHLNSVDIKQPSTLNCFVPEWTDSEFAIVSESVLREFVSLRYDWRCWNIDSYARYRTQDTVSLAGRLLVPSKLVCYHVIVQLFPHLHTPSPNPYTHKACILFMGKQRKKLSWCHCLLDARAYVCERERMGVAFVCVCAR